MSRSWTSILVRTTAEPRPGSVTSAVPPTTITVDAITMTYVRKDALCNGGPIVRLTVSRAASMPLYSILRPAAWRPRSRPHGFAKHERTSNRSESERAEQQCRCEAVP